MKIEPGYESLAEVLQESLDEAQKGKGKERHACDNAYEDQLMCATQRLLKDHPCGGLAYQVIKKTVESGRLLKTRGKNAALKEIYGAVNYLGGIAIIYKEEPEDAQYEEHYSAKNAPLIDLIPAEDWPRWATWAAQDGNGDIFFYDKKPIFADEDPEDLFWENPKGAEKYYDNLKTIATDWKTPTPSPDNIQRTMEHRLKCWQDEDYQKLGIDRSDG